MSVTAAPSITLSSASSLKTLSKSLQSHSSKRPNSFPKTSELDGTREAAANQSSLLYIPLHVKVLGFSLHKTILVTKIATDKTLLISATVDNICTKEIPQNHSPKRRIYSRLPHFPNRNHIRT
ncbi:hypothetical protein BCR33DRAFT_26959 [Rhizoclosmatium globosum]|uniref:Uncharacterized protein n=1 Tax=Rhizoclosmatium globosum TaxID=329046 RepID=A0A1Y2AYD0_9FUNG|nr:hypothetical protein BCR33DRAFT_26959 [Rhizoclosmatium globosum]|eukprot:ORY27300.1 hypothetical protein BCR33DRAFT_26959 [Rhizoclosmatium globosum]